MTTSRVGNKTVSQKSGVFCKPKSTPNTVHYPRTMFLNRRAGGRYRALVSIIPGSRLIKKNLLGRGLTKVENHCSRR
jgi:hypothetical protein